MFTLELLFKAVAEKKISEKTFERIVEASEHQHWLDSWQTEYDF